MKKTGKWRRIYLRDGKQTVYGGDSDCGEVCVYCIAELAKGDLHKNMNQIDCPKCNKN